MFQAVGIFTFTVLFRSHAQLPSNELRSTARWLAIAALLLICVHQLLEPARMTGDFMGVTELPLQRRTLLSATGLANGLRMAGLLAVIFACTKPGRRFVGLGLTGGVLVACSFPAIGHTSINPLRDVLAPLLALHLWVVAFWFGALWPLHRVTRLESQAAAAIVTRFSEVAAWIVPGIALAGIALAAAIVPTWNAMGTTYGMLLSVKATGFAVLMALAVLNKFKLGPALARGSRNAHQALRASLVLEFILIAGVLAVSATMTTMFSPTIE
jgi:putative copper export protein